MKVFNLDLKHLLSQKDGNLLLISFVLLLLGLLLYIVVKRWQSAPYRNDIRFQQSFKFSEDFQLETRA